MIILMNIHSLGISSTIPKKEEKKTIIQCISIVVMVLCHLKQASQHILSNTHLQYQAPHEYAN
jgi:hypothetical protein